MRSIKGVICNYGVLGMPSTGPTIFAAGSLKFPDELRRVKFLAMHDQDRPLGFMASLGAEANGDPNGAFTIAEGPAGDEALAMLADGRRDGLSVGATIDAYEWNDQDQLVVTAATVREVSLVTIPAYSNSLATASAELKGTDMSGKNVTFVGAQLTASAVTEEPTPAPATATAAAAEQTPPAQPAAPVAAQAAPVAPQAAPVAPSEAKASASLSLLTANIAGHFANGGTGSTLTAALTDVLVTDDDPKGAIIQPQWLGELWRATLVERPTIDSLSSKPLTGLKAKGYRRERVNATKLMNKYEGNKTDTPPSGKVKTVLVEEDVQRFFGGWDVDRAIFDFGDEELVRINLEAANDDYLEQTEADAVAKLLDNATVIPAQEDILAILRELGIAAARIGSNLSKIQMGGDLWSQFSTLTTAEVPWWLQRQGELNLSTTSGNAGGLSFNFNPNLGDGEIEAHDKRAATHFETPRLRVQAIDIARGGVDLGLYGYAHTMINDKRAIFKSSLTPVVVP
ncbi:hypothetical protein GT020_17750 [Glutamicibacter soli]|uniref:Prohead serine protease domain-containing protein n=1 Tax=Glutamicibacter soli TaxID=453836 RepID=A0A6L9G9S4_9MICC|nr:HK97 family phage prohead protease [Glutamicibacter soli]NAZ17889.1 hypothetical protein [Glutamicibacter soli]